MTNTLTGHDVEEGKLPEGWRRERIADVLAELPNGKVLNQGKSPQCEKEPSLSDEVWGVLKTTAIQSGKFLPIHNKRLPSSREPDESIEVANGDLLLTCAGPRVRCGVPCLVRETRPRLMLSGKMYRFRPNEELVGAEFLEGYLLSSGAQELIEGMKTGTSESGLNLTQGRFSELPVPIPPLSEQERIVEILEDQLSRLEVVENRLVEVVATVERLKRALLHALHKQDWPEATIADHAVLVTDGDHNPPPRVPEGVPHLTGKNVRNGTFVFEGCSFISEADFERTKQRYEPTPGDVIVTCVGTLGRAAVVPDGVTFSADRNLAAVRCDSSLDPKFLELLLVSPHTQQQIHEASGSTAQPHLYLKGLRALVIPCPPRKIQEEWVERLGGRLGSCDRLVERLTEFRSKATDLRRSLLHSAFTGRLTREWREAVNV
jgi:type I restriction enzyme, S subunit